MSRLICATCLFAVVALELNVCWAQQAGSPPVLTDLHDFENGDRFQQYIFAARKFTRENPDSPEAPRVMFDMILLFTVTGNAEHALKLKEILVMRYPFSTHAAFAVRDFDTAEHCREFLEGLYQDWVLPRADKTLLAVFAMAVGHGLNRFDEELLSDNDSMLLSTFANHQSTTGESTLVARVRQKLKTADAEMRHIYGIILNDDLSHANRFLALKPYANQTGARRIMPVPDFVELRITPEGRLTALRANNLVVDRVRYGKRGSFELAPQVVPERTVQRHETASPTMMFQLFGAVSSLLQSAD